MRAVNAILKRNLLRLIRDRGRVVGTIVMPIFMMFVCSFVVNSPSVGIRSPINYLIVGVDVMIEFQGAFNYSSVVLDDVASGFMREIIVAPISRSSIAVGNILSTALLAAAQGIIVLFISFFIGFRTTVLGFLLIVLMILLSGIVFSPAALFLSLTAKNQTNYMMVSSFVFMPVMLLSGAYVPTTILPKIVLPLVYVNPLTYLTGAFRYIALGMTDLTTEELIQQGVAFRFGSLTVTPAISWILILTVGTLFFFLCVMRFKKVDLSEIQGRFSRRGMRR